MDFYCHTHNQLCCAACLSRIKNKEYGQHTDCNVSPIEDIKEQKINKLKENIRCLGDISKTFENSINELKQLYQNNNKSKEELKNKITYIFLQIINAFNERKEKLLLEVDKKFEDLLFKENLINEGENLPFIINDCLQKGKLIIQDCDQNKITSLNSKINDCINIENLFKNIIEINNNIEKKKLDDIKLSFIPEKEELNKILGKINEFGQLIDGNNKNDNSSDIFRINKNNENNKNNDNNQDKENDNQSIKNKYSYECVHLNKITEIYRGTKDLIIKITLKNNKRTVWPKGVTKLVFDNSSDIGGDDIILEPQGYNEQKTYDIKLNHLDKDLLCRYNSVLFFEVNGIKYGEQINLTIIVKERNDRNDDLDKIKDFRKMFNLSRNDYPDDKILDSLKKYKNKEEAYVHLIGIS